MEKRNRKTCVHFNRETGSDKIFAMFDGIQSKKYRKRNIESFLYDIESFLYENLLSDLDTKFIVEEPIPRNKEESHQILTPEATVQVESNVLNESEPPRKKLKQKVKMS